MNSIEKITLAEAHLFVGVAIADGVISEQEYAQIPYYAKKSQKFFDMMKMNSGTAEKIGPKIREIMNDSNLRDWNSDQHLERAVELIKECKESGVWQSRVIFAKNEKGFVSSAKIEGYVIKEADYIKKMEVALSSI
jgi:hypothetical protein